jgi:protein TonB
MRSFNLLASALLVTAVPLAWAESESDSLPECNEQHREIEVLEQPRPYYPHSAQLFCLTGWVKTSFTIDVEGRSRDIEVVESQPENVFEEAALDAIARWRFTPACREGRVTPREAVQTIEFRLPKKSQAQCEKGLDGLDGPFVDLLGELSARYAVLADAHMGNAGFEDVAQAIETPMTGFSGDAAAVADYHQRVLEDILARSGGVSPEVYFSNAFRRLLPGRLAEDPDLAQLQAAMSGYRERVDAFLDETRSLRELMHTGYTRLERTTELPDETLSLLVKPFLGNVEAPAERWRENVTTSLERLQALVDLLVLNRDDWRVDGSIEFDDPVLRQRWDSAMTALRGHREQLREQRAGWLKGFRDYAD